MLYYFFNPGNSALFPKCPFNYATGLLCPGCGSQRAIHELLHFKFAKAFHYNALLVLAIPYVITGFAFNFDSVKERFPKTRKFLFGQKAVYIVLAVVLGFFILRNF